MPATSSAKQKLRRRGSTASFAGMLADSLSPRKTDPWATIGFKPNEGPQSRFLDLPDENLDVLYGGAGGGGKSAALLALAIRTCVRYPGIQVFWFRRSFPELNQSVLRMLARYGFCEALGAKWNGSKYELRFPGGAVLTFAHAKNVQEAASLSSAEINMLILDERTTIPPAVVDFLYTRVRSGVRGVPCLGIRSASNPGHVGHGRVKADFVTATDYGKREIRDAAGRRRIFIPAKVSDNPHVGDYEKTLDGIPDPELRRMIRDGDWSVFANQAFPDWKPDKIVVPAFTIPDSWARHGGLDYGWSAPSVFIGGARDADGRLWLYRELAMTQTPEREQARKILALNSGVRRIAADPAMWGKVGSALPPAKQMIAEGLHLAKADNDRLGGKARMHTYLSMAPACAHHRALGLEMCPLLHVLDGTCPDLVRTMSDLPRDPTRPEDVDSGAEDHWYDAARYLVMDIGGGPQFPTDLGPTEQEQSAQLVAFGRYAIDPSLLSPPALSATADDDEEGSPWDW